MTHTEILVLVPNDRIDDFYAMYGRWIASGAGSDAAAAADAADADAAAPEGAAETVVTVPSQSRYLGLVEMLERHDEDAFEADFDEIEEAIGSDLPASAVRHRSWWSNSVRNSQARVWLASGWRVSSVDIDERTVRFERD